jgi:Pyruvate/2-oxoacid:ferredoxin oxidoreductase delta subunit
MTVGDTYAVLAERLGLPGSVRLRKLLEHLMSPEQSRMVVELPALPEEIAAKLNIQVATVKQELDKLYRKGVVFPRNFETVEGCRFARDVMQLHDATQSALRLDTKRHKTLFALWEDFATNEWDEHRMKEVDSLEAPIWRIVPAYKSLQGIPGILPHEDVREILAAADLIAVVSCVCRQRKEATGNPCARSHDAVCLQLNRGAEYAIWRGTGTRLTLDGALELVDEIEEDGIVHMWANSSKMKGNVMCNCCDDCCVLIDPLHRFNIPYTKSYAKSRYQATVDTDICSGCQDCVDRCPFYAIDMAAVEGAKKLKASVDAEKCLGCGVCVVGCGDHALSMETVRPPEHIPAAR